MTNEEKELIEAYRKMREIYPKDDLLLISPARYMGYNIETGKKIILIQCEVEDENN